MHIRLIIFSLQLPGCRSLKEKRQRMAGFKDKFGRLSNVAVTESDYHNSHDLAEWNAVIISKDKQTIERITSQIESGLTSMDVVITEVKSEWI
ncbi:DUF503 domain-containing protein [Zooshikella marina]|uniref:DUF503 domain-containing protein n=1 Tax=Zooshikella ganghwensis TaxID=202772 RepID=A0A4P9VUG6_9GAMM|nr:DUF503 family protein [Zooshikella ganghwensis]MBU2706013.1 DUF503 domain-containing protein [Zooshikella ganghwensis]RDH46377.1 DUF503 domain-containing protein [Zooshikella ganghwensis]